MMDRRSFLLSFPLLPLLSACKKQTTPSTKEWQLFHPQEQIYWKSSPMSAPGPFAWEDSTMILNAGNPMTGSFYSAWEDKSLPLMNYQIEFEAQRVEGNDFFATLTFPVGAAENTISLVLGGWGGELIGISCIDGYDASENSTTAYHKFQNGTWYRVKVELADYWLRAWLDERLMVQTNLKGRQLSLRGGDIIYCQPFGFASYLSKGLVRALKIRQIEA